jgi:hypothetical protein
VPNVSCGRRYVGAKLICPKCGAEYLPGFTHCSDCDVPLVDTLSRAERPAGESSLGEPVELVTVFRSGDPGRIALAKSILQSASVPFVVLNESVQNWVGLGTFPAGFNIALGPVEIQVARPDADDARQMLGDLEKGSAWTDNDEDAGQEHS